MVATHSLSI